MKPDELDASALDALIDRLVDGDMTAEDLRAAVVRLDRDPDGWRRCALAFLESQALRVAFRALEEPEKHDPARRPAAVDSLASKLLRHRWIRRAAAAVIIGVSFGFGWIANGTRSISPPRDSLVHDAHSSHIPPMNEVPGSVSAGAPNDTPQEERTLHEAESAPMVRAVASFRFGPEGSPAEVPVLEGPGINEEWLAGQPPPVSEHGQAVLASQGYQVEQRRRFITTVLADGRRVAIPVDHVQIQYTGNEPL